MIVQWISWLKQYVIGLVVLLEGNGSSFYVVVALSHCLEICAAYWRKCKSTSTDSLVTVVELNKFFH